MATTIQDLPREVLQQIFEYAIGPRFVTKATAATILSDDKPKCQGILSTIPDAVLEGPILLDEFVCHVEEEIWITDPKPVERDAAVSVKEPVGAPQRGFHENMIEVDKAATRLPMLNFREYDELMQDLPKGQTAIALDIFAQDHWAHPPDDLKDCHCVDWYWSMLGPWVKSRKYYIEQFKDDYTANKGFPRDTGSSINEACFPEILGVAWLKRLCELPPRIKHVSIILQPPMGEHIGYEVDCYAYLLLKLNAFFGTRNISWSAFAVAPIGLLEIEFNNEALAKARCSWATEEGIKYFKDFEMNPRQGRDMRYLKKFQLEERAKNTVGAALSSPDTVMGQYKYDWKWEWDCYGPYFNGLEGHPQTMRGHEGWQTPWGFRLPWMDSEGNDTRPITRYCECSLRNYRNIGGAIEKCCFRVSDPELEKTIPLIKERMKAQWAERRAARNDVEDSYEYSDDGDNEGCVTNAVEEASWHKQSESLEQSEGHEQPMAYEEFRKQQELEEHDQSYEENEDSDQNPEEHGQNDDEDEDEDNDGESWHSDFTSDDEEDEDWKNPDGPYLFDWYFPDSSSDIYVP